MRAHDVFSSTLKEADWSNASILEGDVATEAANLKAQVGKDLVICGPWSPRADIAKASLARRTQALDSSMFCGSRQVALPGRRKHKAQTHRARNFGGRRNRRLVSARDSLNGRVADE